MINLVIYLFNIYYLGAIVHLGRSMDCGHYVCYSKVNGDWIYFNDEKVAKSNNPLIGKAYILIFKRENWKFTQW
jgi:ubiquitin carboxyl-terminal hydrolase 5/13